MPEQTRTASASSASSTSSGWTRDVLVRDERRPDAPALVRYGPHLFVSGSEGHRRLDDETVDAALADDADAQCRNAYGRIARRLEQAGYDGEAVVLVQNFTSGQHWRAQRMNLWPAFFGEENHRKTVSFGAQARMNGINMLTAVAWAIDPALARHVAVPSPARGRASRITRVGDLVFVIGVRAHGGERHGQPIPEETADSFAIQLDACFDALQGHLQADGLGCERLVRVDAAARAARFVAPLEQGIRRRFDGKVPFALAAVGMPLGARGEMEVGGIAVAAGATRRVQYSPHDARTVDVAFGGGLAFVRNVSGAFDEQAQVTRVPAGDLRAQVARAVANIETLLAPAGLAGAPLLRFDVYLRDIYAQDEVLDALCERLGKRMPVVSFLGAEPRGEAALEIAAIAGNESTGSQ